LFDIGKMQRVHGLSSQHLMQLDEATSHWQDSAVLARRKAAAAWGQATFPAEKGNHGNT
jgi:hypothetical protein